MKGVRVSGVVYQGEFGGFVTGLDCQRVCTAWAILFGAYVIHFAKMAADKYNGHHAAELYSGADLGLLHRLESSPIHIMEPREQSLLGVSLSDNEFQYLSIIMFRPDLTNHRFKTTSNKRHMVYSRFATSCIATRLYHDWFVIDYFDVFSRWLWQQLVLSTIQTNHYFPLSTAQGAFCGQWESWVTEYMSRMKNTKSFLTGAMQCFRNPLWQAGWQSRFTINWWSSSEWSCASNHMPIGYEISFAYVDCEHVNGRVPLMSCQLHYRLGLTYRVYIILFAWIPLVLMAYGNMLHWLLVITQKACVGYGISFMAMCGLYVCNRAAAMDAVIYLNPPLNINTYTLSTISWKHLFNTWDFIFLAMILWYRFAKRLRIYAIEQPTPCFNDIPPYLSCERFCVGKRKSLTVRNCEIVTEIILPTPSPPPIFKRRFRKG